MQVTYCFNPLSTDNDFIALPDPGEKLSPNDIIARNALVFSRPVLCVVDGDIWGRADWDCPVPADGVVRFVEFPRGGGGSNPLQIIATIAIVALSIYTGGLVGAAYGAAWGSLASAGVMIVGSLLLGMLFPYQSQSSRSDLGTPDTIYSVGASNRMRIGEPYAERFGTRKFFPDFAQGSFTRIEGQDQYLYGLFVLGIGHFSGISVYIDKTPLTNYAGSTYNIIQPGNAPAIVTRVCWTCSEAGGQELETTSIQYIVNPRGTVIYSIEYDVLFGSGLVRYDDRGNRQSASVTVAAEVRLVDDYGNALSGWATFHVRTYSAASKDPLRFGNEVGVPLGGGRYEIKIWRTAPPSESSQTVDRVSLVGIRGFGGNHPAVAGVTMLEVKIKATDQLNGEVASKINAVATRMLNPVTATGFGGSLVATRSIVDAVAYMVTSANGGKQSASLLVWDEMFAARSLFDTEGYFFDWGFTSRVSVMDAAATAARCGLAVPFTPGGLFCLALDRAKAMPSLAFSGATGIDKDSLKITHDFKTPDTPDHVRVAYTDPITWLPETVDCVTLGGGNSIPLEISLDGCTDRTHAWKVGIRMWKDIFLTVTTIEWVTGLMGHLPTLFSWVAVGEETVDWGQTGVITATEPGKIWLSEPVDFAGQAQGWLMLQGPDGSSMGPYVVLPTDYAHCVEGTVPGVKTVQNDDLGATPYIFGPVSESVHIVRVMSIAPQGRDRVSLIGQVVNVDVYDLTGTVPSPSNSVGAYAPVETVQIQREQSTGDTRYFIVAWSGSATSFRVEINSGSGYVIVDDNYAAFTRGYSTNSTAATISARITPYINGTLSPAYAKIGTFAYASAPTGLNVVKNDGDPYNFLTVTWNPVSGASGYRVAMLYGNSMRGSRTVSGTSTIVTFEEVYDLVGGDALGITIQVLGYVNGFETLPAEREVMLKQPHPAPSVSIVSQTATSVTLSWNNVDYGTVYGGAVVGWVYKGTLYAIYSGPTAGFDPAEGEGTLIHTTTEFGTTVTCTLNLDLTAPNVYYLKIAAAYGSTVDPSYLNFASRTVTGT